MLHNTSYTLHDVGKQLSSGHRLRWLRPDFLLALIDPCLLSVLGRFGCAAIPFDIRHSALRDSRGPEVEIFFASADLVES